jgi:hypothetical protein
LKRTLRAKKIPEYALRVSNWREAVLMQRRSRELTLVLVRDRFVNLVGRMTCGAEKEGQPQEGSVGELAEETGSWAAIGDGLIGLLTLGVGDDWWNGRRFGLSIGYIYSVVKIMALLECRENQSFPGEGYAEKRRTLADDRVSSSRRSRRETRMSMLP